MNPGDKCQLLGNMLVRHYAPCPDGHKDGVVTNAATGVVLTERAAEAAVKARFGG